MRTIARLQSLFCWATRLSKAAFMLLPDKGWIIGDFLPFLFHFFKIRFGFFIYISRAAFMLLLGIGHGHPLKLWILQFQKYRTPYFCCVIYIIYVYFIYFYISSIQIQHSYEFPGVFFFPSGVFVECWHQFCERQLKRRLKSFYWSGLLTQTSQTFRGILGPRETFSGHQ